VGAGHSVLRARCQVSDVKTRMSSSKPGQTSLSTRGHHHGQAEGLPERRMREHVVLVLERAVVAHKLEEANLVVNDE
jgi:hypothetical protein